MHSRLSKLQRELLIVYERCLPRRPRCLPVAGACRATVERQQCIMHSRASELQCVLLIVHKPYLPFGGGRKACPLQGAAEGNWKKDPVPSRASELQCVPLIGGKIDADYVSITLGLAWHLDEVFKHSLTLFSRT